MVVVVVVVAVTVTVAVAVDVRREPRDMKLYSAFAETVHSKQSMGWQTIE